MEEFGTWVRTLDCNLGGESDVIDFRGKKKYIKSFLD